MPPGTLLLLATLACLVASAAIGALPLLRPLGASLPAGDTPPSTPAPIAGLARAALLAGFGLLAVAVGVRAVVIGHAPWSNLYEVTQAFALFLLGAYLVADRRAALRELAPLASLVAALLVGVALLLPAEVVPLAPALQAPLLLTFHVGAAIAAYAVSGLAFVAGVAELVQRRAGDRVTALPSAARSRAAAHRAVLIAFPILTAAIALGSVWANLAWRSYWNNDPKELAAAATWLLYAAYLHVAGRGDRQGRWSAWLLVAGFGLVLFTYLGASLLVTGQHSYAGV